jgi:formylglycine-generating enzyme required for sulfatase activity/serine/threonine protein kinase
MLKRGDQIGEWIVDQPIGRGGMGQVFRCHSMLSERVVAALKVVGPEESKEVRERFVREVESLAALEHEAVVGVRGGGQDAERDILYLVMELIDGESLRQRIDRDPLEWRIATMLFRPLADGLAQAHAKGIRHRDLKPENIMLTADGSTAKLVDFGIAVHQDRTRLTRNNSVPGTLVYIPPEAFRGKRLDPTAGDIYSFGLTLYEALVGLTPFSVVARLSEGERLARVMAAKLDTPALEPGPGVPDALAECIARCTSPSPGLRPTSMRAVVAYLDAALAGQSAPDAAELAALYPAPEPTPIARSRPETIATVDTHPRGHSDSTFQLANEDISTALDLEEPPPPRRPGGLIAAGLGFAALGGLLGLAIAAYVLTGPEPLGTPGDVEELSPLAAHPYPMVSVSRGGFFMGSPDTEVDRGTEETRHPVDLTQDFELGATEVTQGLWYAVMGDNPVQRAIPLRDGQPGSERCSIYGVGDHLPVFCVSWLDAVRFSNALSEAEGLEPPYKIVDGAVEWFERANGYRLPTEAEWEYAARAGTATRFAGADDDATICDVANVANPKTRSKYRAWLTWKVFDCDDGHLALAEPRSLAANAWGLYDMTGNVWEWTWDPYAPYPEGAITDPSGTDGDVNKRVIRGGSWDSRPKHVRVANRGSAHPLDLRLIIGLRLARTKQ